MWKVFEICFFSYQWCHVECITFVSKSHKIGTRSFKMDFSNHLWHHFLCHFAWLDGWYRMNPLNNGVLAPKHFLIAKHPGFAIWVTFNNNAPRILWCESDSLVTLLLCSYSIVGFQYKFWPDNWSVQGALHKPVGSSGGAHWAKIVSKNIFFE